MPSLTNDESNMLDKSVEPNKLSKSKVVVRMYRANGGNWEYTGTLGALVVVSDFNANNYFIKILNVDNGSVQWEHEFYENLNYQPLNGWLHSFESENGVVGFSFAEEQEAREFLETINTCKNTPLAKGGATGGKPKKKNSNALKGFKKTLNKAKNGVTKLFKSEKEQIVVGGPKNFRHASHIGWGQEGFQITDLPDEWKNLFKKAGIKKSEIKDKETAQYILSVISDAMYSEGLVSNPLGMGGNGESNNNAGGNSDVGGPPPPPKVNAPIPPPPPKINAPTPPPPPSMNYHATQNHETDSGSGGGSGGFLEELQQKKTSIANRPPGPTEIPNLKNISETQESNLVNTLANAMKNIRQDVGDSDDSQESGWSEE